MNFKRRYLAKPTIGECIEISLCELKTVDIGSSLRLRERFQARLNTAKRLLVRCCKSSDTTLPPCGVNPSDVAYFVNIS